MMTRKLFGGVALAALFAGAAQAQLLLTDDGSAAVYPQRDATDAATNTEGFIHSEFQPSAAANQLKGDLLIGTNFGDVPPFELAPVDARARLVVELTNATFGTPAAGTNVNSAPPNAPCDFINAAVAGGGSGSSSVTFLSNPSAGINGCTGEGPVFEFRDVTRTANGAPVAIKFTYTQVDASGNNVANPVSFNQTLTFADVKPSWGTVAADHKITAGTTIVVPPNGKFGAAGAQTLGTAKVSFVTTANAAPAGQPAQTKTIFDRTGTIGTLDISDDLVAATGSKLVLTFPQGTSGFDQTAGQFTVSTGGTCGAPVTTTAPAQTVTCTLTGIQVEALTGGAIISGTKVTDKTVSPQIVTAALTVASATDIGTLSGPSGDLVVIDIDDGRDEVPLVDSAYKWVAFGSGGTESQFRVSGMTQAQTDAITAIRVMVPKGGNGVSAPALGYFTLTNTGDVNTGFRKLGQTITFNSKGLGAAAGLAAGVTGNADIASIELQYNESVFPGTDPVEQGAIIRRQIANRNPTSIVAVPVGTD